MTSLRRLFLTTLLLLALPATAKEAPNIILILTDDQGWSQTSGLMDPTLASSRSEYLETPHMDRLAKAGMRFTSGYSPAPLCTPTRRSILCGTTAARSGTEFASPKWIPAKHMTIPKAIKQANPSYRCAHFGKWGEKMISSPEECGYDVSDGHTGNVTGGMADKEKPFHIVEDPKRTGSVTDRAIAFMREQVGAENPFYAQVSYYAVHLRTELARKSLEKYQAKGAPDRGYSHGWAGMLEELDHGIGRLLAAVDDLGIVENTYVIFTTDNGGRGTVPGGKQGSAATNHPLTGAKHSLNEGGIRVPFMVRGPGIKSGSTCRVPVAGYDFLATFHDLAGGKADDLSKEVDGVSIRALFTAPAEAKLDRPNDALFFHRPGRKSSVIRQGDFKLMLTWNQSGEVASRALYKVDTNPTEEGRNIAAKHTEKADAMQKILVDHLASVNAEKVRQGSAKKRRKPKAE